MDEFLNQRMSRPGPVGVMPSSRAVVPAAKGMFASFSWWWIAVGAAVLLGGYLLYTKMTQKSTKPQGPYQGVRQPRQPAPPQQGISADMAYAYQQARQQAQEDARDQRPKGVPDQQSFIPDPPTSPAGPSMGSSPAGMPAPQPMVRPPNDVEKHGMPMLGRNNPFNPKTNSFVA